MLMTGCERMAKFLKRKPHDRIPLYEHFWGETLKKWREKDWLQNKKEECDPTSEFGLDVRDCWAFNCISDLDFKKIILEENEDTYIEKDGNGAILRHHKHHDTTPEHIDYTVKDRSGWETLIKPRLTPTIKRINFTGYRSVKNRCGDDNTFFCWSGANVFEQMVHVCGHQYMLMGMIDDPEWIRDMCDTYAGLLIALMEILFAKEGKPDGIWFNDDLGFKGTTFMSPSMYDEFIKPAQKRTFDYAKSINVPVIFHSCGMVEKLIPSLIEAGIDCLQALEVKAGMDILKLYKQYGSWLSFMGGIDIQELISNDPVRIDQELLKKIPILKGNYGYALHSDHSIPPSMDISMYRYFIDHGLKLGKYSEL